MLDDRFRVRGLFARDEEVVGELSGRVGYVCGRLSVPDPGGGEGDRMVVSRMFET